MEHNRFFGYRGPHCFIPKEFGPIWGGMLFHAYFSVRLLVDLPAKVSWLAVKICHTKRANISHS